MWKALGAFLVGGASVAGVGLAYYQVLLGPQQIETPSDLLEAINGITAAIEDSGIDFQETEDVADLNAALGNLVESLGSVSQPNDGALMVVPTGFNGLFEVVEGRPVDFQSPSGRSFLVTLRDIEATRATVTIEGSGANIPTGNHITIRESGDGCRVELISTDPERDRASVRFRCLGE